MRSKNLITFLLIMQPYYVGVQIVSCAAEKKTAKPLTETRGTADAGKSLVVESTDAETVQQTKPTAAVDSGTVVAVPDDGIITMAAGFEKHVHEFVIEKCGGCHGSSTSPLFASDDEATAFDELFKNGKIDFFKIDSSRMLLRLEPEKHYCWTDCGEALIEMKAKLTAWKDSINDGSIEKLQAQATKYTTLPQLLGSGLRIENPDISENPGQIVVEAESAMLLGGLVASADPKGSGGRILAMAAAGNIAVFNFNVTVAGNYFVYGLTSSAAITNSTLDAKFDAGTNVRWVSPVTGANAWRWNQVKTATTPLTANLGVGEHTLTLTRVQNGFKIDAIAITNATEFASTTVFPDMANVLIFDLSKAQMSKVAPGITLEIQAEDYDANSYKFKSPLIRVPDGSSVKIKGLKVVINGTWNPQNATYLVIDETVSGPGRIVQSSAMIVPKEKGLLEDQISFQFEVLE